MNQLLNERNKVLASLMIQKQREGENFSATDQAALDAAIARLNSRAAKVRAKKKGTKPKHVKATNNSTPIDWDSGKDARAEGHITRATTGVKKPTKAQAKAAAKAHGEKVEEGRKRLKRKGDAIIRRSGGVEHTDFEDPHFGKEARNEEDGDNRNTPVKLRKAKRGSKERAARMARKRERHDNTV